MTKSILPEGQAKELFTMYDQGYFTLRMFINFVAVSMMDARLSCEHRDFLEALPVANPLQTRLRLQRGLLRIST